MDYFQKSLNELSVGLGVENKKKNRFNINPRKPIFGIYLFVIFLILLLLIRPAPVKKGGSIIKLSGLSLILCTPWIIWYYYG